MSLEKRDKNAEEYEAAPADRAITVDVSPCEMPYCVECRPNVLRKAAESAGIAGVSIYTDLQAVAPAWDKLDEAIGIKTREPVTEMMRRSGDWWYDYARGSLSLDAMSPKVERIARCAGMVVTDSGKDHAMVEHEVPSCKKKARLDDARARAEREQRPLRIIGSTLTEGGRPLMLRGPHIYPRGQKGALQSE